MQKRRPQLLLVDDEPNMLEMLRRMLSQEAENWDAHFCGSVDEAMTLHPPPHTYRINAWRNR